MRWVGVVVVACILIAGTVGVSLAGTDSRSSAELASPACSSRTTGVPHYSSVVVIAFENHDYSQILGSSAPPSYFKTLAGECGSATDFTAALFPHSLPNYLAVTSGSTDGISGDCLPSPGCDTYSPNIFSQVGPSGWSARAESMPAPCFKTNSGEYVPRHVPAVYYTRIPRLTCLADAGHLPLAPSTIHRRFVWVAANLENDMHDGTESQASAWLESFLAGPDGLLTSPTYRAGHMAIFIWFDSAGAEGSVNTPIPLIVVAPSVGHRVVKTHLDDYYILHGWEGLLGETCLKNACAVSGFDRDFHL